MDRSAPRPAWRRRKPLTIVIEWSMLNIDPTFFRAEKDIMGFVLRSVFLAWILPGLVTAVAANLPTVALAGDSSSASGKVDPAAEEFFEAKVRPVLAARCYGVPWGGEVQGGPAARRSGLHAQGGRERTGGRAGQARREHADRGDPLRRRGPDASQGEAQGRGDRRPDGVGQARRKLARAAARRRPGRGHRLGRHVPQ